MDINRSIKGEIKLCIYGSPKRYETQGQVGQLRLICHPELRDGIADWSFKGEEGTWQDNKSRCLVSYIFALYR